MPAVPIRRHATSAGYVLDFARGAPPGPLDAGERELLRNLAKRVLELAHLPQQAARREAWYRHNALERGRPLILLFPENSWEEILPESVLKVRDPFWRDQEWFLRHILYRAEHFADDFVVEPELVVGLNLQRTGWGLHGAVHRPALDKGAYKLDAALVSPDDIHKLKPPTRRVDVARAERERDALGELFGDILAIRVDCAAPYANLIGEAAGLRGIDQLMIDMYDRPEWVHQLMAFITQTVLDDLRYLKGDAPGSPGYLTLNNGPHYNDSGGIGYSRELPAPDFDGRVRPRDLWGFGVAQEMVLVGPAQHKEFLLDYQVRILRQYGLNAYGCCEPYTRKYDMLEHVPRLRRVSVSPWSDIEVAAERLGDRCIFSWKPDPAMLVGAVDYDRIRRYIRRTLEVARGCVLEMILKDTYTVEFHPERLDTWARIAREEVERAG